MEWFKVRSGLIDNRKFQLELTDTLKVRLINLWCLTARHNGVLPSVAEMAYAMRLSDQEITATLKALMRANFIEEIEPNVFRPHDWEDHNPPKSSAERVKQHRERKKKLRVVSEPQSVLVASKKRVEGRSEGPILPAALLDAFNTVRELHDPGDGDNALRLLISMAEDGRVTEADAPLMVEGMRRWLRCEDWTIEKRFMPPGPAKDYRFKLYEWIRNRAWTAKPKLSAEAEAAQNNRREAPVVAPDGWKLHGGIA